MPSAVQKWFEIQDGKPTVNKPEVDEDRDVFHHPLYTPPAKVDTAIRSLPKPLKYPDYDQIKPLWTKTGVAGLDSINDHRFEKPEDSLIGGYPKIEPQFALLRNPYAYWDQQGRRNYGEIVYDHDNLTDIWGIGPETHWYIPVVATLKTFGFLGFVSLCVYFWDSESRNPFAAKDYPFESLRVELGGDPSNKQDNWMAIKD